MQNVQPIKILVADDSDTDRLLLATILRKQGHEIVTAEDGVEAVAAFDRSRPDMVLMDAQMPRMDGFEAAVAIKQRAGEDFIPIIFLTALHEVDALVRCLEVGGDDFLTKPYNSTILQAKVNAFSRMRHMQQLLLRQRDQIAEHNQRMVREQEIAREVFDRVAHKGCLNADNIKSRISPMAIFNGDVALAAVNPAGNLCLLLGDFTGHGLNAAIGAMPLAQCFYDLLEKGFLFREILQQLNLTLCDVLPEDIFCCAIFIEFNFREQHITVWNGGLPDGQLLSASTGQRQPLPSRHLPLGIKPELQFDEAIAVYDVSPGDRILVWTDGIVEAEDVEGNLFGNNRLELIINANSNLNVLFDEIDQEVTAFIGTGAALDDISLLEVKMVAPEQFNYQGPAFLCEGDNGADDWSLAFELRADSLRHFNPLPQLLQVLMEAPAIRPYAGQVYTVISELFSNALEHGLLQLDSTLKATDSGFNAYYERRENALPDLQQGSITINLDYQGDVSGGRLVINVEDSGKGFDFKALEAAGTDKNEYSGRGIRLVQGLCASVEYQGVGNAVEAVFLWGDS